MIDWSGSPEVRGLAWTTWLGQLAVVPSTAKRRRCAPCVEQILFNSNRERSEHVFVVADITHPAIVNYDRAGLPDSTVTSPTQ